MRFHVDDLRRAPGKHAAPFSRAKRLEVERRIRARAAELLLAEDWSDLDAPTELVRRALRKVYLRLGEPQLTVVKTPDPAPEIQPSPPGLKVTRHALERYRRHHPDAMPPDVLAGYAEAEDIPVGLVRTLTGRQRQRRERAIGSTYRLSADCRGIFVVFNRRAIVTYLRLGLAQVAFLRDQAGARTPAEQ